MSLPALTASLPRLRRLPVLVLCLLPALAAAGANSDADDDGVRPGEVLFQLVLGADLQAVLQDYGLTLIDEVAGARTYLAQTAPGVDSELVVDQMLLDTTRIAAAERNRLAEAPESRFRTLAFADGNASFAKVQGQAALTLVGADQNTWTGNGVIVAVLDTGVGPHTALNSVVMFAEGHDFIDEDAQAFDLGDGVDNDGDGDMDEGVGHGTHIAGIIHAIAPEARILPIRVLDSEGQGSIFAIAQGIRYAVNQGARALNLSFGLVNGKSESIDDALDFARARGVLVVTSAGNGNRQSPVEFPSDDSDVLSVASTDLDDRKAAFSNFNGDVDITAPGVSILSLYTPQADGYAVWSGTSMSVPFVVGAAALAIQARPRADADGIADLLLDSAKDVSAQNQQYDGLLGRGRLDIGALIDLLPVRVPSGRGLTRAVLGLALCLHAIGKLLQRKRQA